MNIFVKIEKGSGVFLSLLIVAAAPRKNCRLSANHRVKILRALLLSAAISSKLDIGNRAVLIRGRTRKSVGAVSRSVWSLRGNPRFVLKKN